MKFPSLTQLQTDGKNAAFRFPFSLLFGVLAAALSIYLIDSEPTDKLWLLNLLLTFALGIPLYFCIDVLAEKNKFNTLQRQISWLIGLVFLGLIYLSFPAEDTFSNTRVPYIRYAIYNLAIHLMVAFLPYFGSDNQERFWNYNRILFTRLITGVYYSLVLVIGISLALLAIDALFDANIDGKIYPQIFTLTIGIFNTWFFLAGIPRSFENEVSLDDYPKGLKIFTQFILIPLLLVYLCILYFYGAKIIITGDWPKGIVTYMIVAISVLGIFTNLLLYPYQTWKESDWIKTFHRGYYLALIPLVILLFLAIGIRIQDYGLTVNRYIITLMGFWLAFISLYFSFGAKNIKIIPLSLSIFMILASFGPWGMFSLSERIQRNRLSEILTENNILINDKIQQEVKWDIGQNGNLKPQVELRTKSLPREDMNEVNSILQYLEDYHGMENIYPWFEQDLKTLLDKSKDSLTNPTPLPSKLVIESMNLTYVSYYDMQSSSEYYKELTLVVEPDFQLTISGYDYMRHITVGAGNQREESFADRKYHVTLGKDNKAILILKWAEGSITIDCSDYLKDLLNQYGSGYHTIPSEELVIIRNKNDLEIKLQISSVTITNSGDELMLQSLEGFLLVKEISER
ncbi:uncharacterized protein DUF4153 [Algoriphagus ratkowskyi]|uniref:DUF4153 domain-containing protein n=1 Tax=Algoriphagus ratkowskyi TaxID=57028 RepID=A0A2W7R7E3_9BACT|nr:DUF4153 domain-containing protein [Algoriphagus ratkowskyi]PZX56071.1 uncharacterized protein DUF4153 [Algoriphagus ratkowskyi]TXD77124.1 DUF4153 domain-containing protein [Algoriphagus ratkowskyi]